MNPTEMLKHDHKIAQAVLGAAEQEAEAIRKTGRIRVARIEKLLAFFETFIDECHYVKEEEGLFLLLGKHGMPGDRGLIGQLIREHEAGRQAAKSIAWELVGARNQEAAAIEAVRWNLAGYVRLTRPHCDREDSILFPQADGLLTAAEKQGLIQSFEEVETKRLGASGRARCLRLAEELAREPELSPG